MLRRLLLSRGAAFAVALVAVAGLVGVAVLGRNGTADAPAAQLAVPAPDEPEAPTDTGTVTVSSGPAAPGTDQSPPPSPTATPGVTEATPMVEAGLRPGSQRGRGTSEDDGIGPSTTYAPAPDPSAGCVSVGGEVVEFVFDGGTLGPRCVRARSDQRVAVVNRSGTEAGVYVGTVMETIGPGDRAQFGTAQLAFDGSDRAAVWVSGYPQAVATLAPG